MATITSRKIIEDLIKNNGYYEGDPRAAQIVKYITYYGEIVYGVTWTTEDPDRQRRYEIETDYVQNPEVIWRAE